ncbi:lamin tail domain-containing protein [Peterkaempfera griseoplana]|uniref:lamin tail domain-containing protein n=1 Tax=Peterkaempfera griseoplana TaxID=66896 RepID=UPI0006E1F6FA|nr:lamin tail domain-containing protein [Peterkaempfera griseoplana]
MNARRITSVAAAAALAAGLAAGPAQAATAHHHHHHRALTHHWAGARIGAVQYNSPGRDTGTNRSLNREWVAIVNDSPRAVDLAGWTLRDANHNVYRFGHVWLDAHRSLKVHTGRGRDTRTDLYQDRYRYEWNNNGDVATLRNARGRVVYQVSWGWEVRR